MKYEISLYSFFFVEALDMLAAAGEVPYGKGRECLSFETQVAGTPAVLAGSVCKGPFFHHKLTNNRF